MNTIFRKEPGTIIVHIVFKVKHGQITRKRLGEFGEFRIYNAFSLIYNLRCVMAPGG